MISNKPTNNKIFVTLLLIIFIMPWPHGGEVVWQYLLFASSIFTLAAIYFFNSRDNIASSFAGLNSIKTPLMLLAAWLVYQLLQVIPLPISFSDLITQQTTLQNTWQTISIAPNITLIELIKHNRRRIRVKIRLWQKNLSNK